VRLLDTDRSRREASIATPFEVWANRPDANRAACKRGASAGGHMSPPTQDAAATADAFVRASA